MKVLVTGGSGFLGRHIVEEVTASGAQVVAPRSATFNLDTGAGVAETFAREKVDAVIHSAAVYGGLGICEAEPFRLAVTNLRMAANLFDGAVNGGVRRIVSIGSLCGYPGELHEDLVEQDFFRGRCHPSVEGYGYSKRAQLALLTAARKQHGIDGVQLALTNLYGEHDVYHEYRSHAAAALIKKVVDAKLEDGEVHAWGSGAPRREFVHVRDAAKVAAKALEFASDNEPINVGGEEISIRDLAETIARCAGLPLERIRWDTTKPEGIMRKSCNCDKLRGLLPDYAPIPLADGLKQTVEWYMANKELADSRH